RRRGPFRSIHVIDRNKSRLSTHGEPNVTSREVGFNGVSERQNRLPLRIVIRLRHTRIFLQARNVDVEVKLHLALVARSCDRCGAHWVRGASEGNMSFAGEQSGRWVESEPSGPRDEDLGPGVQIGKISVHAAGSIEGPDICLQLDQVPRDKAGGESQMAQN